MSDDEVGVVQYWTATEMQFSKVDGHRFGRVPRFTMCVKPEYTDEIRARLRAVSRTSGRAPGDPAQRYIAVELKGMVRYVQRKDLLSKDEYRHICGARRDDGADNPVRAE